MFFTAWVALLAGGVAAGLAPVAAMAARRPFERLAIVGAVFAGAASAVGLIGIAVLAQRIDEAVVAGFLGAAAALGGFALGGALLAQLGEDPAPASLPDPLPDPGSGIGIVLLSEAEPEHYDPRSVAVELRTLADAGVQLPPESMRPFIFASEKARYRAIGGSPARQAARSLASRVSTLLDPSFDGLAVAWTEGSPALDEAVADLAGRGFRDIVVAEALIADDAATARARRAVDALRPAAAGIRVAYAEPLWTSVPLATRLAERIATALPEVSPAEVGVALLGNGQAPELEDVDGTRTEQETYFHQRVRAMLVERGFEENHVRLAWAEWQEPGVTEVVRHLAALGCRRILVVPASMAADSRVTLIDLHDAVEQARVEATAEVTVMPAWGDDEALADAVARAVREAAAELRA